MNRTLIKQATKLNTLYSHSVPCHTQFCFSYFKVHILLLNIFDSSKMLSFGDTYCITMLWERFYKALDHSIKLGWKHPDRLKERKKWFYVTSLAVTWNSTSTYLHSYKCHRQRTLLLRSEFTLRHNWGTSPKQFIPCCCFAPSTSVN